MKILTISKPVYDFILPLVEFPKDGDLFTINNSTRTISNVIPLIAITLSKYGLDTSFIGVVGYDDIGNKVKEIFMNNKVDTKYIETSEKENTCINYKIYNSKTNVFTTIYENSIKTNLLKYKYEFIPDVVIMDDGDYGANMAAINNYPDANLIYIANKFTKDSSVYLNKCNYVIANIDFVSNATGLFKNLNKPKEIVNLFQKFIDLYKTNLIIRLDNFDFLYCVNDEVRLIKNINNHLKNKENVFIAVLCYFLIITKDVESSIKYTNKAMLNSLSELDMISNIPSNDVINELNNEILKNTNVNQNSNNNVSNTMNSNNVNVNNYNNGINNYQSSVNNNVETLNVSDVKINEVKK